MDGHLPSLRVRSAQALLTYLNLDPRGVDGLMGPGPRTALLKVQKNAGIAQTADLDDATEKALQAAVSF